MKIFAISDQHYGHENIIKYCKRPVANALEDAKRMIEAHNSTVQEDDLVVFVGDIQASRKGREWIPKILKKLKGRKILVRGNHDHFSDQEYLKMGFERVDNILIIGEYLFCHYPNIPVAVDLCESRNLKYVAGHTHAPFPSHNWGDQVERINVQVDVVGPEPTFLFEL